MSINDITFENTQDNYNNCICELSTSILKNKEVVEKFMDERILYYKQHLNLDSDINFVDPFTVELKCGIINKEILNKINIFSRIIVDNTNISLDIINKLNENTFILKFTEQLLIKKYDSKIYTNDFYKKDFNIEPYTDNALEVNFDSENVKYPKYLNLLTLNNLYDYDIKNLPESLLGLKIANKEYNKTIYLPSNLKSFICNSERDYEIITNKENKFPNTLSNLSYGGKYMKFPKSLNNLHYFGKDNIIIDNENLKKIEIFINNNNNYNNKIKKNRIVDIRKINNDCEVIILEDIGSINNKELINQFIFPEKIDTLKHNISKFKSNKLKNINNLWMEDYFLKREILNYNVKVLNTFNSYNERYFMVDIPKKINKINGYFYLPSSICELNVKRFEINKEQIKKTKTLIYKDITKYKIEYKLKNENNKNNKKSPIIISYFTNLPNKIRKLNINENPYKFNFYNKIKIPYKVTSIITDNVLYKISNIPSGITKTINKIYFENIANIQNDVLTNESYEDIFTYIENIFERYQTERDILNRRLINENDEEKKEIYRNKILKLDKILNSDNHTSYKFYEDNRIIRNEKFKRITVEEKEKNESKKIEDLLKRISCNKDFMNKYKFVKKCNKQNVYIEEIKYQNPEKQDIF